MFFWFNVYLFRKGNLADISEAGSLHEFLTGLHKQFGPIASFWWGKMYTVSIASADLFEEVAHVFHRPRKLDSQIKNNNDSFEDTYPWPAIRR